MSATPHLTLRPSRCHVLTLSIIYIGALCCICIAAAPLALKILAGLVLLYSGKQQIYDRSLLRHVQSIVHLHTDPTGVWHLYRRNDAQSQQVILRGDSLVTPWVVVLNFKSRTHAAVVIWFDSVDATTFRRLRVYLRTAAG